MRSRDIASLVLACALLPASSATAQSAAPSKKIDPNLQALADTERAFAKLGAEKGVRESFMAYFAADGIWFVPHPKRTVEDLSSRPVPAAPLARRLEWAPMYGDVSRAGDLGYDTGPSANSDLTEKQEPTRYGYFFSIWKKQADGNWRVALDVGTQTPDVWDPGTPPEFHAAPPSGWKPKGKPQPEKELAALIAVEKEFAKKSQSVGGAAAAPQYLDRDARLHRNDMSPLLGRQRIVEFLIKNDSQARWEPIDALVAKSADLGYTYGRYWAPSMKADSGEETGYYIHVWRKDAKGVWKLVFHVTSPADLSKK